MLFDVVIEVLDVNSEHHNHFDSVDQTYLEKICEMFVRTLQINSGKKKRTW
jgi:putative methionine-R-sulfoxide reductase with GAF domain